MTTWILTATNRLSQTLREQQQASDVSLILPLNAWLTRTFEYNPSDTRRLLTTAQAIFLWQKIIRKDKQHLMMRDVDVAKEAYEAWCLLQQWSLSIEDLRNDTYTDVQTFYAWAHQFEKQCQRDGYINHCELGSWVLDHLPSLPDKIMFAGFDELTPQIKTLLDTLAALVKVATPSSSTQQNIKSQVTQVAAKNTLDEIQLMVRAANYWHKQNPSARIACIVPTLTELRDPIHRYFKEARLPFNISAGSSLLAFPLIHTAFQIFELMHDQVSYDTVSALLHTPYIKGGQSEYCQRAMLDKKLRKKVLPHIAISRTLPMARNHQRFCYAPNWVECIEELQAILKENEAKNAFEYAQLFSNILEAFGWPGDRELTSEELQLVHRFHDLLDEFIQFETFQNEFTISEAVTLLRQLAANTIFQVSTERAPIQILGSLEAAGLQFDHLWVMGLSSDAWPQATQPNPFLPLNLQRKYNMPHASAMRELEFTRTITQRLFHSAPDVIASYPLQQDDIPCFPSALIESLSVSTLVLPELKSTEPANNDAFESLPDHKGPALSKYKMSLGGTQVLKSQAHCAFQAFAYHRLRATTLIEPAYGLSPSERGELVHHALAYCWRQLKNSQNLHAMNEHELDSLIQTSISDAIYHLKFPEQMALHELEKSRLHRLLTRWIDYEKKRTAFEVKEVETSYVAKIFDLNLKIRIDRIDELDDGSFIIIDYKTGRTQLSDLLSEPLLETQLPLYLSTYDNPATGVLFAEIRSDSLRFNGVVSEEIDLPDTKKVDWNDVTHEWSHQLLALSKAYRSGAARVAPQSPKSCLYCDLQSFCRIHEEAA